jgi:fatty-acyl-CoA synthase
VDGTMGEFPLTVGHILRHGATWHGGARVVTLDEGRRHRSTFAEVASGAARLAGGLRAFGVVGDARVGTLLWNNQAHLAAYLAVPSMGAVLHSANPRLFPDQLAFTINAAEDGVLLVDPDLVGQLNAVLPALRSVHTVVVNAGCVPAELDTPPHVRVVTYDQLLSHGEDTFEWPDVDENSAAALCFTTGTTGDPKGVAYSHRSILLQCLSSATSNALRIGHDDRILLSVPMFHATAWGYPYASFWFGADLVLPSRHLDPATLLELIGAEHITFANGVPAVWNAVLQEIRAGRTCDLSSLRGVVVGGAALPSALMDAFGELGVPMVQGWGMTETSPLVAVARPHPTSPSGERRSQSLSQGRILAGVEIRLMNPDTGVPVPADGVSLGELELRGPWVASSYLGGAAEDRFHDGWLRTGDIGTVDPLGYVRLTDRSKDIIKSGGEWISSVELENCLLAHPAIRDAAVIGVPDERWDERPCAIVVPVPGRPPDVDRLCAWLTGRVVRWWVPERWCVVDDIPRTSVGKIDKKALRASYRSGELELVRGRQPGWPATRPEPPESSNARPR